MILAVGDEGRTIGLDADGFCVACIVREVPDTKRVQRLVRTDSDTLSRFAIRRESVQLGQRSPVPIAQHQKIVAGDAGNAQRACFYRIAFFSIAIRHEVLTPKQRLNELLCDTSRCAALSRRQAGLHPGVEIVQRFFNAKVGEVGASALDQDRHFF